MTQLFRPTLPRHFAYGDLDADARDTSAEANAHHTPILA